MVDVFFFDLYAYLVYIKVLAFQILSDDSFDDLLLVIIFIFVYLQVQSINNQLSIYFFFILNNINIPLYT